jgi:hypothetical protein
MIEAAGRERDPADRADERDGDQNARVGARPPGVKPGALADRCDDPAHGGEHVLASPMSRVLHANSDRLMGRPTIVWTIGRPCLSRVGKAPRATADTTKTGILSKQIQIKPSKNAWISLDLFVRIGTFQWATSKKIKKIDSRLKLCAKRLKRCHPPLFLGQAPSAHSLPSSSGRGRFGRKVRVQESPPIRSVTYNSPQGLAGF